MIATRIDHIALVEGNSEICLKSFSGAEAETFFRTYLNAKGIDEMQRAFDNGDLETTYHNRELTLVIYI